MNKFKTMLVMAGLVVVSNVNSLFAMAQKPAGDGPPPPAWVQFTPFLVMFAVFYFLLIRPQLRQKKEKEQLMTGLKKGDRVVTQGGFIVTISNIYPTVLEVKLNDETRAKILRSAVVDVYKDEADVKEAVVVTAQ